MGGGLLQLKRVGAQDLYLTGNPEMTFFKSVYKKYSNFAQEMIRLEFDGVQSLSNDVETLMRCKIARNGDLINKIYFVMNIPDIFSSYENNTNVEFNWVPNLGTQIIKKCSLTIGGTKISELYGNWIEIWHELFLETSAKNTYDSMTGHRPDLFMPEHNGWNAGFYPTSSLKPTEDINPDSEKYYFSQFSKNPYFQPPSIHSRKLYVPLPFWFATNPGLALPLISLQYHEVYVEIECRPITELYTIKETRDGQIVTKGTRTAPSATLSHHHIGNFITSVPKESFTDGMDLTDGTTNIQGWNQDCHILGNYIYLDNEERDVFALNSHEYLIEQVFRSDFTNVHGTQNLHIEMNHPVKYIVWHGQRSDVNTLNKHNNYTNWTDEFISPVSAAFLKLLGKESADPLYFQTSTSGDIIVNNGIKLTLDMDSTTHALIPTKFNYNTYDKDIIKESKILFDGKERYSSQDSRFHCHLQSYQNETKLDKSGLNMYSFCLDPSKVQPNGAVNMSRISNVELEVKMTKPPAKKTNDDSYQFNVYVYSVNYNLLRISAGMAGTSFAN